MSQSSSKLIRFLSLYILLPIVIVKILWTASLFFLKKDSAINVDSEDFSYHYMINMGNKVLSAFAKPKKEEKVKEIETDARLDNWKLKATFVQGDNSFIIVEEGKDSNFIYKFSMHKGYKLIEVYPDRAVFERNKKHYDVVLSEGDDKKSSNSGHVESSSSKDMSSAEEELLAPEGPANITREELNSYIKNPNKIWKNIRIQEVRVKGKIDGFRVNYVKKNSFFDRAGMKSGDIIKGIDGKEIKSLSDVMKYYSNIDTLDGLSLSVKRGDNEIDLDFNVN
jgi:general secretion pathway protein C